MFEAYGIENIGKKLYNNREYSIIECLREIFIIAFADCTIVNSLLCAKLQNTGKYVSLNYILVPDLRYSFAIGMSAQCEPELHWIRCTAVLTGMKMARRQWRCLNLLAGTITM